MRKDMRLGFGVGGVLLAVIIVAILVIHRNQGKTVAALDKTGATTTETSTIGANDTQPGALAAPDDAANLKPADPLPVAKPEAKVPDPKIAGIADDSVKTGDGTQWDRLFASSSDTAPKSQLRNRKPAPTPAADASPSDSSSQVADLAPTHDADNAMPAAEKVAGSGKTHSAATSDATSAREHVVKAGESFYTIAKAVYGDSKHTKDLQAANPSIDASKLRPGMTLKIPALTALKTTTESKPAKPAHAASGAASGGGISLSARTTTVPDGKSYTVKSGDSLYKIARDLYGNGAKGDDIYALNHDVIGNDSTKLKIGQVLKLPSSATESAAAH